MPASRTAVRPVRQRFILDGREPDGMLAIPRDHAVHRCNLRIVDAVERRGACRSSVVGHTSCRRFVDQTLRGFCRGGIQALWAVGTLDRGRASRRKRRQIASAIAEGRHRADANHAKDLDRTYALAMVSALIRFDRRSRGGSPGTDAVKTVLADGSLAALLPSLLICGRALG